MESTSRQTAADTLALLEERFQRVDHVLNGHPERAVEPQTSTTSAAARLRTLERALQALASKSTAVADLLALHSSHPSLFHPAASSSSADPPPSALPAIVLAHAPLYAATNAHLASFADPSTASVPTASAFVQLADLRPRIGKARQKQDEQAREFAELRTRSARVVEKWYEGGVLEMGEQWADWEERLRQAEILVRRTEARKRREDEGIV